MNRRQQKALQRWLRHERGRDEARAEKALRQLMVYLPRPEVPAGFADRVLLASGVSTAALRARWALRPWVWRTAFVVWLSSSFIVAVGAAGFFGDLARSGEIVGLGARALAGLGRLGAELATALDALLRAGNAVATAASAPAMLAFVMLCAFSSLVSLRALVSLMATERSSRHA